MADEFDLANILDAMDREGMSAEEKYMFIRSALSPKAREAFRAGSKVNTLKQQYDEELAKFDTSHMNPYERTKKISNLKRKYRDLGLEVW